MLGSIVWYLFSHPTIQVDGGWKAWNFPQRNKAAKYSIALSTNTASWSFVLSIPGPLQFFLPSRVHYDDVFVIEEPALRVICE